jgi:hypothetical protein
MKSFASRLASSFCRHQHSFPEGRQYLDSHYLSNERSWMAQREPQFLPIFVDPRNIRLQNFLIQLLWVLLCDYCSYFLYLSKTSELGWLSMPTRSVIFLTNITAYRSEYVPPQNCLLPFSRPPSRALQLSTSTHHSSFELHDTSMGHARLVCTQFIFTHLMEGRVLQVPFSLQRVTLENPTISLSYNNTLSRRNIDGFWLYVCS